MEQHTSYPPLMRAPLKLRGVFGLSWQLYKRGFWPMFGFTLLLIGVFMLILMLALGNMLAQTGTLEAIENDIMPGIGNSPPSNNMAASSALTFMSVVWLCSLIYSFLVMPAYMGATFLEMDQRMEGRVGTFGQLFRYALPIGLKRFYTTFLSQLVVQIIASIVMGIVINVIVPIIMISSLATGNMSGVGIASGIAMLCGLLLNIVYMVFITLIYPVAAHEGKRAFNAVGRGIKLSLKRFGRLLGALTLYALLLIVVLAIVLLPLAFLWQNTIATIVVLSIGLCLCVALIAPYNPALYTALYVGAAARVPDLPQENPVMPPVSPMPQA